MRFDTNKGNRDGSYRKGINGGDPWSREETNVGKRKLEHVHANDLMGGKWYPTPNIPMYHMGDKNTVPEGPGVKKFETEENGVRWIAFAPINPLSKTPVDIKNIFKIRADSKSIIVVPIVWRINLEAIEAYLKNQEDIGEKLSGKNKYRVTTTNFEKKPGSIRGYKSLDLKTALNQDIQNDRPDLYESEMAIDLNTLKKTIAELNSYYGQEDSEDDLYSDDDGGVDGVSLVGAALEKETVKKAKKPKNMLNIGVKYENGTVKWWSWPVFVLFESNEDITMDEKKQIRKALKMLEKSRPETWRVLDVFNR